MPRRGRRGYPTAVLIGLNQESAHLWTIYSESVKPSKVIIKIGNDDKSLYRFYEEIIDNIRNLLSEGFTGIIFASENRSKLSTNITEHLTKHYRWMTEKVTIRQLSGKAGTIDEVIQLIKTNKLQETVNEANEEMGRRIIDQLESALENGNILYTVDELNLAINSNKRPTTIIMTENFQRKKQRNSKFNSVLQISKNLGALLIIIKPNNPINLRLTQLGEFICIITP